ncbi:MAG: PQQ-binding-like beta-propeller repeat protein [Phycisphaerae bacterium]|nr:PQQ-binding-like beta-propeller repeat protein [Phycisphaerae bacterium]
MRNSIRWILVLYTTLISGSMSDLFAASGMGQDWPQFRGPTRDGKSAETGLLTEWPADGPQLLWSKTDLGAGFSHVATAEGLVYGTGLIGKEGILWAYTLDGQLKWKVSYGPEYSDAHPGARTIPTVHEKLVYVVSAFGKLSCFQAADGKPVWSADLFKDYDARPIQWGFSESVLIDGDQVFATPVGKKAAMVSLDRRTGKPVWASPPLEGESSFCSPLLVEHGKTRMIVTLTNQAVAAFSPEDGAILWQFPYENARQNHCVTPIYHDGILYVTSGYGKGAIALAISDDGRSVKQLWEQPRQDPVHGQAVLVDGYVYASSHQKSAGRWTCVDFKTGKLVWDEPGVGKGGSVIWADGLLYCYSEDGNVGMVRPSPDKCQVISAFKVPMGDGTHWAHPVVSHGRLFLRHGNALMCYDIAKSDESPKS